jgi:hypothetical protein
MIKPKGEWLYKLSLEFELLCVYPLPVLHQICW